MFSDAFSSKAGGFTLRHISKSRGPPSQRSEELFISPLDDVTIERRVGGRSPEMNLYPARRKAASSERFIDADPPLS